MSNDRKRVRDELVMYFPYVYEKIRFFDDIGFGEWIIETDNECLIYDEVEKTIRNKRNENMDFAIRLRRIMRHQGIGQGELSDRTGLSKVILSRYMNGRAIPTFNNAEKLADALNCSLDDFRYK